MVKPEDLKVQMWFKNNKTKQPKPFSQTHQIFQPSDSWNFISSSQMPRKPFTNYNRVINFLGTFYPRLLRIEMIARRRNESNYAHLPVKHLTPFCGLVFSKSFNLYRLSLWNSFVQARPTFFESCLVCLRHTHLLSDAQRWIFFPFSLIDCNTAHTPTCDFSSWNKKNILLYDEIS